MNIIHYILLIREMDTLIEIVGDWIRGAVFSWCRVGHQLSIPKMAFAIAAQPATNDWYNTQFTAVNSDKNVAIPENVLGVGGLCNQRLSTWSVPQSPQCSPEKVRGCLLQQRHSQSLAPRELFQPVWSFWWCSSCNCSLWLFWCTLQAHPLKKTMTENTWLIGDSEI